MPSRGVLKAVDDQSEPDLFGSKTVSIGDKTYTIRELTGKLYDECVELASVEPSLKYPDGIDRSAQLKFMAERAISPKISMADLQALPFSKRALLFDAVNEVHFRPAPAEVGEGKAGSA